MPCDDPTTAAELFALVERADHAIAADDPSAFTTAWGEANRAVLCLEEPLPRATWARLLYG